MVNHHAKIKLVSVRLFSIYQHMGRTILNVFASIHIGSMIGIRKSVKNKTALIAQGSLVHGRAHVGKSTVSMKVFRKLLRSASDKGRAQTI